MSGKTKISVTTGAQTFGHAKISPALVVAAGGGLPPTEQDQINQLRQEVTSLQQYVAYLHTAQSDDEQGMGQTLNLVDTLEAGIGQVANQNAAFQSQVSTWFNTDEGNIALLIDSVQDAYLAGCAGVTDGANHSAVPSPLDVTFQFGGSPQHVHIQCAL